MGSGAHPRAYSNRTQSQSSLQYGTQLYLHSPLHLHGRNKDILTLPRLHVITYVTRISAHEPLSRTIFTTFSKVICRPTYTCPFPRTQICRHFHKLKRDQMVPVNNHTARRRDWKFARSIEKTLQILTNWWTWEHSGHKLCSVSASCRHSPLPPRLTQFQSTWLRNDLSLNKTGNVRITTVAVESSK
jgi:hypothetical protein